MINSPLLYLALTFMIFYLAYRIHRKFKSHLFNPVLITIIILIIILKTANIDYQTYKTGGKYIEFWLKPAVVALGYPLYKQLKTIRQQFFPILMSQLIGSSIGIYSVTKIATLMGASNQVILSLAPKSITTPIAIEVSKELGGLPSLTAAVVVCVGIFGSILGLNCLKAIHKFPEEAEGISIGTASHALGTAQMFNLSDQHGTFATLGLILNGILTSLLAPIILGI